MQYPIGRPALPSVFVDPGHVRPELEALWHVLDPLNAPWSDGGFEDVFARLGPNLARSSLFAPASQAVAPGSPSGGEISPAWLAQIGRTRQQLHAMEPRGQRVAHLDAPWGMTELTPEQAAALLRLLVMYLLSGGGASRQPSTHGGAIPGSGGRAGGGGFQPSALAPGRFVGVPTQSGRDLGALSPFDPGAVGADGAGVTPQQLRQIAPNLSAGRAAELTPHLNRAMAEAGITTRRQKAAFIAQLAQESGGFKYFEELASGAAYEGRRDLGNTRPGDGRRFKGRGPIQLTGRANYRAAGRALGLDLENNPELVSRPDVGFRVAAWYWKSRGLNSIAESGNFREVTRRINGGYNGLAVREQYYRRALGIV